MTQVEAAEYIVPPVPAVQGASGRVCAYTEPAGLSTPPVNIAPAALRPNAPVSASLDALRLPRALEISEIAIQVPSNSL